MVVLSTLVAGTVPAHGKPFDLNDLRAFLRKESIDSPDALLDKMSANVAMKQSLETFALLHKSEGQPQKAVSARYPRVLFRHGNLVFAFTGNPGHPSFHRVEMFEYLSEKGELRPHELVFGGGEPTISERPEECLGCHGEVSRFIWGAYPLWPGAYGALADRISTKEELQLQTFIDALKNDPGSRYRHFVRVSETKDFQAKNLAFGLGLSDLNFQRMLSDLKRHPRFNDYRYAYFALLIQCEDPIDRFLPQGVHATHAKTTELPARLLPGMRRITNQEYQRRKNAMFAHDDTLDARHIDRLDFDERRVPLLASMRYLAEPNGVDMQTWSMSRRPGGHSYSFSTGNAGFLDFMEWYLAPELIRLDPTLEKMRSPADRPERWKFCDELKAKSLKALTLH